MSEKISTARKLTVSDFRPMESGALRGFAQVNSPSGTIMHGCGIFEKDRRWWASPPVKPILSKDGTVQRDSNLRKKYEPIISFVDRATEQRWSAAVIEALREAFPEVMG